jgi:hypothetical protein
VQNTSKLLQTSVSGGESGGGFAHWWRVRVLDAHRHAIRMLIVMLIVELRVRFRVRVRVHVIVFVFLFSCLCSCSVLYKSSPKSNKLQMCTHPLHLVEISSFPASLHVLAHRHGAPSTPCPICEFA